MTQKKFRHKVLEVFCFYSVVIIMFVTARVICLGEDLACFQPFSDLMPLIPLVVAVPAAWLAYCFQRRQAHFYKVEKLWSKMVSATQSAVQYTHLNKPGQSEYGEVLKELSIVIDEIRAVFANLYENERNIGFYPFENMKNIYVEVSKLGFGNFMIKDKAKAVRVARDRILIDWRVLRHHFLSELSRGEPVRPNSPYL